MVRRFQGSLRTSTEIFKTTISVEVSERNTKVKFGN